MYTPQRDKREFCQAGSYEILATSTDSFGTIYILLGVQPCLHVDDESQNEMREI